MLIKVECLKSHSLGKRREVGQVYNMRRQHAKILAALGKVKILNEAPVTEAPVTEAPVTEVPVTEVPVTEVPVAETPVAEVVESKSPKGKKGSYKTRDMKAE